MVAMIKKYLWNDEDYNKLQMRYIILGRGSDSKYGNIDDLDHKLYVTWQMYHISLGRGSDTKWGNIDDLDPKLYNCYHMKWVSYGRGTGKTYCNLDDLDPRLYGEHIFQMVSLTGKIDIQEYKSKVTEKQYLKTIKIIKENNPEWLI